MKSSFLSRRAVCVLAVVGALLVTGHPGLALNQAPAPGASAKVTLLYTQTDGVNGRTIYSYQLEVPSQDILEPNKSRLTLSDSAGIVAIGNAIGWRTFSFTDDTATWKYVGGEPPGYIRYSTFDLEADPERTQPGTISYHVSGQQDTYGTVEGPVALSLPEEYQISGTDFLDDDADGVFDGDNEDGITRVSLALLDGDGVEIATVVSNGGSYNGGGYLGNYVFDDVEPGSYTVVVTDLIGTLGGLSPTTPTEQDVTVSNANVREVDFGYTEAGAGIWGRVFFDADQNGLSDDDIEMGFDEVEVTLTWQEDGQPQSETRTTDSDGFYDFGTRAAGEYTVAVTADTKWGLFEYFDPTTPASYDITMDANSPEEIRRDFGFYPNWNNIHQDITGNNKTIGFWKTNIEKAMQGETNGIQVTKSDLLSYLAQVEALLPFPEPFGFGADALGDAYVCLHPPESGNSPLARLERQLLAAELNYVSVVYRSDKPELERAIIWYAEYVRNYDHGMAGFMADELDTWNNLGDD